MSVEINEETIHMRVIKLSKLSNMKLWVGCAALLLSASTFSAEDTTTQPLRVIIPKIALIDVDNTNVPLVINFNPMTDAGDNFATITATSRYDVTSNILGLQLHGKTDIDLANTYNLKLEVNESGSFYRELTTTAQRVSTQSRQAQKNQALNYRASPAVNNKTIPYGSINVTVTYTLVEP